MGYVPREWLNGKDPAGQVAPDGRFAAMLGECTLDWEEHPLGGCAASQTPLALGYDCVSNDGFKCRNADNAMFAITPVARTRTGRTIPSRRACARQ